MDALINILALIWTVIVLAVGAVLLAGILIVGAIFIIPILIFTAAFL
jgi:hypothetical protein